MIDIKKICLDEKMRIPIEYRTNKKLGIKFLNEIKNNQYVINNYQIYVLADYLGISINNFNIDDTYSIVESVQQLELYEQTYDLSIDEGNSYTANGIICHNTVNLPEDVTIEKVQEIYQTAWESGCKGMTIYRKNSRSGVLVDTTSSKKDVKTEVNRSAPKRNKNLNADIHHFKIKGQDYYVTVGLNDTIPYEIFVGENHKDEENNDNTDIKYRIPKKIKNGIIEKVKRGCYNLIVDDDIYRLTGNVENDDIDALTRMISTTLRHGINVSFVVQQLEKIKGFDNFPKALARALKKYIKDGTKVSGENCPSCSSINLMRQDGCVICADCGWTKC